MLVKPIDDDPSASLFVSSKYDAYDDDSVAATSIKPLLSRSSSFSSSSSTNSMLVNNSNGMFQQQKRRRRTGSDNSFSSSCSYGVGGRRSSLGEDVSHVASETFLITRLGLKLLRYLGYNFDLLHCH